MNNPIKLPLLILCAIAVVAGFWLFNPLPLYFLNDDFIHIPLSKNGIIFQRKSFRPICDLSIGLDYFLWKKNAIGYHVTNLLLHVMNTILMFFFSSQLYKRYSPQLPKWSSIVIAVLFFIYPFHSESIYWIIGRSGSLGTLFFLASAIFYLNRHDNRLAFVWSALFFSIGLLTYESIWIFPLIALLISWWDAKENRLGFRKEIKFLIGLTVIFIVFLLIRYLILGELAGDYEAAGFKAIDFTKLLLNGVRLLVRSFAPPVQSVLGFYIAVGLVFLILAIIASSNKNKSKSLLMFIFACFLTSLLPYLSLGVDTHGVEGERFLYLPSVFACVFLIYTLITLISKEKIKLAVIVALFAYCLFYLSAAQKNYSIASNITRKTMQEINLIKGKKQLFVDSLPEEYNGALIFRLGFYEGMQWINSGNSVKSIFVSSSKSTWKNVPETYKVIYRDSSFFRSINYFTSPEKNEGKAAIFFNDTAMIVVK